MEQSFLKNQKRVNYYTIVLVCGNAVQLRLDVWSLKATWVYDGVIVVAVGDGGVQLFG
jgi:hypothetical protein